MCERPFQSIGYQIDKYTQNDRHGMLKDDEGQKYQEDQGWTVCEKASPQVGSQSVLSQQRDSKLRSKQTAR